jgi:hypothetical protein
LLYGRGATELGSGRNPISSRNPNRVPVGTNKKSMAGTPFLRVPVPAGTNGRNLNSVVFIHCSEQTFWCLTKVHSRKKFGLHKENVLYTVNTSL